MKQLIMVFIKTAALFLLCCFVIISVESLEHCEEELNDALGMAFVFCLLFCSLDQLDK